MYNLRVSNSLLKNPNSSLDVNPFAYFKQEALASLAFQNPLELLKIPQIRFRIAVERWKTFLESGKPFVHASDMDGGVLEGAFDYNKRMISEGFYLPRTFSEVPMIERPRLLINPLLSIDKVRMQLPSLKILTIGPRTEYEILMLMAAEFQLDNIVGLDLFTYSPWIDAGDMHDMPYEDNSFDIVSMAWSLTYSNNIPQVISEVIRVTKPDGIVSLGVGFIAAGSEVEAFEDQVTIQRPDQLNAYFGQNLGPLYFQHYPSKELESAVGAQVISIIGIDKPRVTSVSKPQTTEDLSTASSSQMNATSALVNSKFTLVTVPDWSDADTKLKDIVLEYVSLFVESDAICLILWIPSEANITEEQAFDKVFSILQEAGHEPESIPEIALNSDREISFEEILIDMNGCLIGYSETESMLERIRQKQIKTFDILTDPQIMEIRNKLREQVELSQIVKKLKHKYSRASNGSQVQQTLDIFEKGYQDFLRTGKTTLQANMAMRSLYCLTKGELHQHMLEMDRKVYPLIEFPVTKGVFGELSSQDIETIVKQIDEDGYYVFEKVVPDHICDELSEVLKKLKWLPSPHPKENGELYDFPNKDAQVAPVYHFLDEKGLLAHPYMQNLISDPTFLRICQAVYKCQPLIAQVGAILGRPFELERPSYSGELFHMDMCGLNFMVAFIYLNDINIDNGPHSFVKKSHREKHDFLYQDRRFSDEEISKFYDSEDILDFTAPKGSIVLENTIGFHRGKPLKQGERIVGTINTVSSRFGPPEFGSVIDISELEITDNLKTAALKAPRIFQHYQMNI